MKFVTLLYRMKHIILYSYYIYMYLSVLYLVGGVYFSIYVAIPQIYYM